MNLLKPAAGAGLLIAACAACCAPLIAPWVVAAFAAGGASLAFAGQVGLAVLIAGAGGLYIWSHRRTQPPVAAAAPGCGCVTEAGQPRDPRPTPFNSTNP